MRSSRPQSAAAWTVSRWLSSWRGPRARHSGLKQLLARLDDRFRLLTGGRRTAVPRHQTLRATLDWSYELLPEPERVLLRRLAIFAGGFTLTAASAVGADADSAAADAMDGLANLVAKSLVVADVDGVARYRLLETTRAYALEKLAAERRVGPVARRHAEYLPNLFERAETEWETRPTAEWLAVRLADRQFARGARLGLFGGWRPCSAWL